VKSTEHFLVVLESTAVAACTHEVVVRHTVFVTAADRRSRLGTDVTPLTHTAYFITHNTATQPRQRPRNCTREYTETQS